MTNYNDGKIHGWNGGDCPVHPETVVRFWKRCGYQAWSGGAGNVCWDHGDCVSDIIAFQVVEAYVGPKVIWVNEYPDGPYNWGAHPDEKTAKRLAKPSATRIAVKYVEVKE